MVWFIVWIGIGFLLVQSLVDCIIEWLVVFRFDDIASHMMYENRVIEIVDIVAPIDDTMFHIVNPSG